jgi:hypothetical protein
MPWFDACVRTVGGHYVPPLTVAQFA